MKELIKFFTPIIWLMLSVYLITLLLENMNQKDTLLLALSTLGILLIGYLTVKFQLGAKLFKN